MQLACFTFALWPFQTLNLHAINALGRSDIFLILEIVKKGLGLIAIFSTVRFGVWWMIAVGAFVMGPMSVLINSWPNRKLLGYTIGMQLRDVLPAAMLCGGMVCMIMPLSWLALPRWGLLLLQIFVGMVSYFLMAWVFRLVPLCEMARIASPLIETRLPKSVQSLCYLIVTRLK